MDTENSFVNFEYLFFGYNSFQHSKKYGQNNFISIKCTQVSKIACKSFFQWIFWLLQRITKKYLVFGFFGYYNELKCSSQVFYEHIIDVKTKKSDSLNHILYALLFSHTVFISLSFVSVIWAFAFGSVTFANYLTLKILNTIFNLNIMNVKYFIVLLVSQQSFRDVKCQEKDATNFQEKTF